MSAIDPDTGIAYESILFPDRHVEISFTEEPDRGEGIARIQTLIIDGPARVPNEWAAMIAALTALVDAGRVALRNPPDTIASRPRG